MNTNYAGFWLRFGALIIDTLVLGAVNWILLAPVFAIVGIQVAGGFPFSGMDMDDLDVAAMVASLMAIFGIAWVVKRIVEILYHSLMESSKFQGSLGKMALGIIVTDSNGAKLDFSKALIRNLCKIISGMTMAIGYIMAGFTEKKQALHDILASTLVVKK